MPTFKTHQIDDGGVHQFEQELPQLRAKAGRFEREARAARSKRQFLQKKQALVALLEEILEPLQIFQSKCLAIEPLPPGHDPEPLPPKSLDLFSESHKLEEQLMAAW